MKCSSVVICGNTNNYPLVLGEGLRALGYDVRLIVTRKELLHRPEAKYPEWNGAYPEWIFDCSDLTDEDIAYESQELDRIVQLLTYNADLVVLNDAGVALATYIRAPHVAMLTGSDLAFYANFDSVNQRTSLWDPEFKRSAHGRRYIRRMADFVARQRDGILSAAVVTYGQRGLIPTGDLLLDQIGVQDGRRMMLYLSDTDQLRPAPPSLVKDRPLRIFSGCRIVYRRELHPALSDMDFKGTDIFLQGFATYCDLGGRGELRLPRKGQDFDDAVALVRTFGIEDRITWLDETPLAQFHSELAAADLVCDQFGSSFPGMVTSDAFALGRPVMANLRNEIMGQRFPEPLPGFDACTPAEIAARLLAIERDPELLSEMGARSRAYAEEYLSPRKMAMELIDRVSACAA